MRGRGHLPGNGSGRGALRNSGSGRGAPAGAMGRAWGTCRGRGSGRGAPAGAVGGGAEHLPEQWVGGGAPAEQWVGGVERQLVLRHHLCMSNKEPWWAIPTSAEPINPCTAKEDVDGVTLLIRTVTAGQGKLMRSIQKQSSVQKLLAASPKLSPLLRPTTFQDLFMKIDTGTTGYISMEELTAFVESPSFSKMESLVLEPEENDSLKIVFDLMDKDHSGSLEKKELLLAMTQPKVIDAIKTSGSERLQCLLKPGGYKSAFMEIETADPGHISLSEFRAFATVTVGPKEYPSTQKTAPMTVVEAPAMTQETVPSVPSKTSICRRRGRSRGDDAIGEEETKAAGATLNCHLQERERHRRGNGGNC